MRRLGPLVLLLLVAAGLWATSRRFAFHSDEMTVLLHAQRFWEGHFQSPGRPGLLWLVLAPLAGLPSSEAILRGGRVASFLFATGTAILVAWLGRPRGGAHSTPAGSTPPAGPAEVGPVLPLLALACAGTWATHGVELRTDTATTPLTLLALALLWGRRARWTVPAAALCVGAAVLISQKSAYNALGLTLAWLLARPTPGERAGWRSRDATVAILVGVGTVAAWYGAMSAISGLGSGFVERNLAGAARTAFGGGVSLEDKLRWWGEALERGPALWGLGAVGLVVAAVQRRQDPRPLASGLVAVGMLAVLPLHRGFFPYYIASIEPFLALPAAAALAAVGRLRIAPLRALALALPLVGGIHAAGKAARAAWDVRLEAQLDVAREADRLFERPVPYIGGIHMVPGDRELAGYLTAEMRTARRRLDPEFVVTMIEEQRPLYFVHDYMTRNLYLRPAERRLLHARFVPHRHNLYVHAGRASWPEGSPGGTRDVVLHADGPYTVRFRGNGPAPEATVDGRVVREGEVLTLTAGPHEVAVGPSAAAGELWLVVGHGTAPESADEHVDLSLFPKDRDGSRSRFQAYDRRSGEWDLLAAPGSPRHTTERARHQRRLAALDRLGEPLTRLDPPPGAEVGAPPAPRDDDEGPEPPKDEPRRDPAPEGDEPAGGAAEGGSG